MCRELLPTPLNQCIAVNINFLTEIIIEGAGKLYFNTLQLIFGFNWPYLKKMLRMVTFGSQIRLTRNKHDVHCKSKFCWWNLRHYNLGARDFIFFTSIQTGPEDRAWRWGYEWVELYIYCVLCASHGMLRGDLYIYILNAFLRSYSMQELSNPITGLDRPLGFQEVEAPRFLDNRHMKVVRLSALRTGRVYPPGNTPGTHFC
jgi:hypothetical protein